MTNERIKIVMDALIDDRCDGIYGIEATVDFLLNLGLTREELIELKFDPETIDRAIDERSEVI